MDIHRKGVPIAVCATKTLYIAPKLLASLACAALLIACGNSQASAPVICPATGAMFPIPPDMIYPQSGAAGVPDGNFPLVLAYNYGTEISLAIAGATVVPNLAHTPVPSPLPSPAATLPPLAAPVAFAVPQLQSATTYSVIASLSSPTCDSESQNVGTFTTR